MEMSEAQAAQVLIAALEPIPEENWCRGELQAFGRCCALGHLGYENTTGYYRHPDPGSEVNRAVTTIGISAIWSVNDSADPDAEDPEDQHPKRTVLKYLRSILEDT